MPSRRRFMLLVVTTLLLAGCASAAQPEPASAPPSERTRSQPLTAESLTIGIEREPAGFISELTPGVTSAGGGTQVLSIAHEYLVVEGKNSQLVPRLATSLISLGDGSWQMQADGTMDTTWHLRPNVRWQDGTPFTADDLVFSFSVYKDPEIPNQAGSVMEYMDSVEAPDPHTLVVHWRQPYVRANEAAGLTAIPKHLLEAAYRSDKENFAHSSYLGAQFVGLGPFRLTNWEPGAFMEFSRFDDYFLGRPRLDHVTVRFLSDPNTMVANILSDAVDVLLPTGVDLDAAVDVGQRWEGTGNEVFYPSSGSLRHLEIQHRPEFEKPVHSTTVREVRQALYQAIDRAALVDVVTHNRSAAADSWYPPTDPLRPLVETAIPQFPYDPSRAQQLLAQAGWIRSGDSALINKDSGEGFEIQLYGSEVSSVPAEQGVIADGWKAVGAQVDLYTIPAALGRDREFRSKLSGAGLNGAPSEAFYTDRLHSKYITSPANHWIGGNRGGYSNPKVDQILDRLIVTVDPDERVTLHRQLLAEQMGDVALMPLYWDIRPILALKSVRGIDKELGSNMTWNIWMWEKQ